jgi:hypothetical protein
VYKTGFIIAPNSFVFPLFPSKKRNFPSFSRFFLHISSPPTVKPKRERKMNATTKKKIQKKCKIRGYNIKIEALDEIISFAARFEPAEQDEAIDLLLDGLENESCNLSL